MRKLVIPLLALVAGAVMPVAAHHDAAEQEQHRSHRFAWWSRVYLVGPLGLSLRVAHACFRTVLISVRPATNDVRFATALP